jgi:hypothetical protein
MGKRGNGIGKRTRSEKYQREGPDQQNPQTTNDFCYSVGRIEVQYFVKND